MVTWFSTSKAACKLTQQPPTLLRQQCWELLRACWQLCAKGSNNSQQCWGLQCIVGRIQPISLCKPCVTMLEEPCNRIQRYCATLRRSRNKRNVGSCWLKSLPVQTLRNNTQQHPTTYNRVCKRTQHVTSNNVGSFWPTMLHPFARGFSAMNIIRLNNWVLKVVTNHDLLLYSLQGMKTVSFI